MRKFATLIVVAALGITILPNLLGAASKPCPLATGKFDAQAGASNQITTCKVLEALALVEQGRIVRLGRVYEDGIPIFGTREYNFEQLMPDVIPGGEENEPRPTGGPFGDNRIIFNDGIVFRTEIDQVGTQFDGPGHIGRATGDDPRFGKYFLGLKVKQVNATPDDPVDGLRKLGVEHVKPLITRGILVDLARKIHERVTAVPCFAL